MIFGKGESEKMIQTLPVNCYNYNLIFHFNKNQDAYANQIATRINGKYHIHGDVLVFHEMDKDIFINLGIREFKRINILSYGSLKNREPSNSEIFQISDSELRFISDPLFPLFFLLGDLSVLAVQFPRLARRLRSPSPGPR